MSVKTFVARSLRPWRLRVLSAHAASLILGVITGLMGVLTGPAMLSLFSPNPQTLAWPQMIGPWLARIGEPYLPAKGVEPDDLFALLPVALLIVATIKAVAWFYQWYTWEWLGEQLAWQWRTQISYSFTEVAADARDDGKIAEVETSLGGIISQDIRNLREFVVHYYGGLPREGLQAFFTAITLCALSPKLFGIFVFCIAPVGAVLSKAGRRLRKRASRALADNSQLAEWIQQRLLGLETIKHYRAETRESLSLERASNSLFERFRAAAKIKSRTSPMIEAFGVLAMSIALWVAFTDIADGAISGAVVMSFFATLAMFAQSAAKLGRYFNSNNEGNAAGLRVIGAYQQLAAAHEASLPSKLELTAGEANSLRLKQVSVIYKDREKLAVTDFTRTFYGGRIYCLVGKSGAGKSTVFNAILGLRPIHSGSISGTVSKKWASRSLDIVSMPQQVHLVPTSLELNVAYPFLTAESDRVKHALDEVHFSLSANRTIDGLKTAVGPGGLQLSGGQAQRLQMARVIYHNAPFVLVDEGTSALDPVTEADVLRALRKIADEGVCVIMIAHRRAAAEISDEVLVMQDGKLALEGSPQEVLQHPLASAIWG